MKILMINKFLYPKGGAETYTLSLGNILKNHGHKVQYFGLRNPKNTVGNDEDALVDDMDFSEGVMKNLKAPLRIVYNRQARKEIRKVLDSFEPDIVHLNNIQFHLTQPQFRGKTITLHNFKDIAHLREVEKKDYILEFGKLCKDKGTETLLEAARQMPDQKFVFVGYGPAVDSMNDIPNVEYRGFKGGEELNRIIAEAKISVCPSEWYENCPFSVIESISFGTPVVGSRMGGIPELIEEGKTGELFEAGNVNELIKAINKIVSNEDVLKQYTNNCSAVRYETSETYYRKLMDIYRKGVLTDA